MPNDLIPALRNARMFQGVSEEALRRVAERCVVRGLPAGRFLFRMGDPCAGLWMILEGRIRVYRANRDGKEQVIHLLGPGRTVADVPLFDGGPVPANARAEEDSRLLFLPRAEFEALYRSEPEIADAVIRDLGSRLRRAVKLIEKISLRDVPSRVGLTLLEVAGADGRDPSRPFVLRRTQGELAESLAATRESVARALRTLREEGLIEQEGARVRIPDPEALESRCWGM
jgi:CRP-like cAMP-binding protein